jgi:hypothetical protein
MRPSVDAVERRPPRPPNTIEILDFSLAAVSSAKGVSPIPPLLENGKRSRLVGPSMLVAGRMGIGFFKDDVGTHLPCVSMEWELQREYALYMIYEDGIIGVDVSSLFSRFRCVGVVVSMTVVVVELEWVGRSAACLCFSFSFERWFLYLDFNTDESFL